MTEVEEVDVKQAIAQLYSDGKGMTQADIAAELGCTQANVHYHLNNPSKKSRAPAVLVQRLTAAYERRQMALPMSSQAGRA